MSTQLRNTVIIAVVVFMIIWFVVFYHHERHHQLFPHLSNQPAKILQPLNGRKPIPISQEPPPKLKPGKQKPSKKDDHSGHNFTPRFADAESHAAEEASKIIQKKQESEQETDDAKPVEQKPVEIVKEYDLKNDQQKSSETFRYGAQKGILVCKGERVDSEVIYWRIVPHDIDYESPITPHHDNHHDRYLSFEYDQGGWNNVRMSLESLIVVAHAMGRTLVIPPQQHLYLLGATHKDPHDAKAHDEMGFEDFFDLDLLRSHRGFHVLSMQEFLEKEGVTGGLHGVLPPGNKSDLWGGQLWSYLNKVADAKPVWMGRFVAFPKHAGDFNMSEVLKDPAVLDRFKKFGGDRSPVYYDETLQQAHHIHFPAREHSRILQHHYAFAFFADQKMQSFYRRFVRDFMRYKDNIQCSGAELVGAVRADARRSIPGNTQGDYYALHIRRGDFQYKDVKISAEEIVQNLHFKNGTPIIPPNSLVYVSTDDPDGICKDCYVQRKPCTSYTSPKPVGCPEDTSWNAFIKAGWKIRFLRDYMKAGYLHDINPNIHGMVESIVCSRAKVFAGTYYSTFTGYIHRIRGYHGLGESTYYHSKQFTFNLQMKKSVGHGWPREWRIGWTDDAGELI